jgi:TRAP-type transport system periplasmic protein
MVNRRKLIFNVLIIGVLLAAILLLNACSQSSPPTAKTTTAPTASAAAAPAAAAPEKSAPITLTYSTPMAEPHPYSTTAKKWMEYVEKETGGKVKFKPYWGGTLISGTEGMSEIAKGVADCGWSANFQTKGNEITNAMTYFVSAAPSGKAASKVCVEVFNTFPAWGQETVNDLRIYGFTGGEPKYIMTTRAINSLADLKGMTISAEPAFVPVLKEFGAAGQMMPTADTYISVQKGILDGVAFSVETCKSLKFAEVCKFINNDLFSAAASRPIEYFNRKAFNSLPPDVQKAIEGSIDYLVGLRVAEFEKAAKDGYEVAKTSNVKFTNLSADDKAKWVGVWQKVATDTAKSIDALGKPGTPVKDKCQELIKKYNQ